MENQNFTANMSLISSNGLYSMRLGYNFYALYAKFQDNSADHMYWKHTALEARAAIVQGQGPIHALVNSDGYLGLYQNSTAKPVDVQPFNSYQRPIDLFLLVRLEPDGNLKAYYWDGSNWVEDFEAISDTCQLPSPCGSYGLCTPQGCSCLDNRTEFRSSSDCVPVETGDFCGEQLVKDNYEALRRNGVEVPFKELMQYETTSSLRDCEGLCENNCSCWGAVYNNASGFCFMLDYPIQTLVSVGDESKVGYFKVREGAGKKKNKAVAIVGLVVGGGAILVLIGIGGFWTYRIWRKKTREEDNDDEVSPGPYKNLGSESSKSIEVEMCNR